MIYLDTKPFLATCREGIPYWISFEGEIPKQAVKGGREDGQKLFIGRAAHNGSLTPGKILEASQTCIIPWGTIANEKVNSQILMCGSDSNWVLAENGRVPTNAFPAGHSEQGETLFIGRVKGSRGDLIVGKVQPSHRVCYIAQDNREMGFSKYEVFVV